MRALVVAFLLIALIVVALPAPARAGPSSNCTPSNCRLNVTRAVATNSWGVTIVTDKIAVNDTVFVSNLTLGIPTSVSDDLQTFQANDTSGASLRVVSSSTVNGTYTALVVTFPSPVKKYNFTLSSAYWGLLAYSPGAANYTFNINPFPIVDNSYNATGSLTIANSGGWSSPKIAPPNNQTSNTRCLTGQCGPQQLKQFDTTVWKISFVSASSLNLFSISAGRTITISPSDSVQVTDNYNLTNLGPTVSSVPFTVPKGASGISESYVLGPQIDQPSTTPTPTANPDGTSTVTFSPSFGSVLNGQSVRAKISYTLSPSTYVSQGSLGTFTLRFALFSNVQFFATRVQTMIVTPMGFRLNSVTGQVPFQTSSGLIIFQSRSVSPLSNLGFSLTYQLDPFWAAVSPLSWAVLIELAIAGSVVAVWKGPGVGQAIGVPVQLVTKFVDLYDEKSSMRLESEKMEEDLGRGALNRYDYRQRRRSLDRRMDEVDRALAPLRVDLSSTSSRYQEMIRRIERAEAELQVIRTTSADLKSQYRSGKISRDLYESLSADLVKRKQRAGQSMDTIIINLREEIR